MRDPYAQNGLKHHKERPAGCHATSVPITFKVRPFPQKGGPEHGSKDTLTPIMRTPKNIPLTLRDHRIYVSGTHLDWGDVFQSILRFFSKS